MRRMSESATTQTRRPIGQRQEPRGILLVGATHPDDSLIAAIGMSGREAVHCRTLLRTVDTLGHRRFAMVIVDAAGTDIDLLELVLNINDIDDRMRVFVLADARASAAPVAGHPQVHVVNREELVRKLSPTRVPFGRPDAPEAAGRHHE